ncbi:uncharacterized protein SPAPADRAFT_151883 [Spathaspora passalidarum NRRL Y-27907]|uniref:Pre-mRNA-splicing factor 18 n=1 Tax=Spathaspora passalidarum (strain NRRL Y-27907 / 11-Y1) TaxID=619300 RepID=G3AKB1_SPAPN|nr:uncharacterized protein SPAPADRAFT_151883 [Spathaspora passalidarum NRRL Y-27907]EGW33570.1 hypothetical protein SPAPADRAFT_151883 [Spathaspora passalidarum NRRL Y-27907]
MDFSSLISKEINKKRKKVGKTNAEKPELKSSLDEKQFTTISEPAEDTTKTTEEPPLTEEQLDYKLSQFDQPTDNLTTKEKITKLKQLLRYQSRNEKYKEWLDKEAPYYQDPTKQQVTLDLISNLQSRKDKVNVLARVYIKEMIKSWQDCNEAHPSDQQTALLFETKRDIVPLLYGLRTGELSEDILTSLTTIIYYIQQKDYRRANESYMKLSIGNVAWPIGVLNVGIHARSAAERITGQKKQANIMIDDKTRRWITSIKRLITAKERIDNGSGHVEE